MCPFSGLSEQISKSFVYEKSQLRNRTGLFFYSKNHILLSDECYNIWGKTAVLCLTMSMLLLEATGEEKQTDKITIRQSITACEAAETRGKLSEYYQVHLLHSTASGTFRIVILITPRFSHRTNACFWFFWVSTNIYSKHAKICLIQNLMFLAFSS